MAGIYNLNTGANLNDLYKDLDESKLEKIKSATVEELSLVKGIDLNLAKVIYKYLNGAINEISWNWKH